MLNLVYKEFITQRRTALVAIFYSLFMMFVFNDSEFRNYIYVVVATGISYIFILNGITFDERNKVDILLNSMPLERKSIIGAKYLSFIMISVLAFLISFSEGMLINATSLMQYSFPNFEFAQLTNALFAISLLVGIIYPLYLKFGIEKTRIYNIIIFVSLFILPKMLKENLDVSKDNQWLAYISTMTENTIVAAMFAIALIFFYISYAVSRKIYENKEF